MNRYDAIIFDLYGTLIDELNFPESIAARYWQMMSQVMAALNAPEKDFRRLWSATSDDRHSGVFDSIEATLRYICKAIGLSPAQEQLDRAVGIRMDYLRQVLKPRPDTLETIAQLREMGYRIGLISDCTAETSVIFPDTPFASMVEAAVLSCEVGITKPDPRMYELACERLGVAPSRCLYIGDGNSNELTGASNAGMTAVLIRAPYDTASGSRQDWNGVRISSIAEVFDLIKSA